MGKVSERTESFLNISQESALSFHQEWGAGNKEVADVETRPPAFHERDRFTYENG